MAGTWSAWPIKLKERGRTEESAKLLEEAIVLLREATRQQARLRPAPTASAGALSDQGKLDEAVAEYREAIRIKPDDAEAHRGTRLLALRTRASCDEAVSGTTARRSVSSPTIGGSHNNLGDRLGKDRASRTRLSLNSARQSGQARRRPEAATISASP